MQKKIFWGPILVLVSLSASLLAVEGALRAMGYLPWRNRDINHETTMHEPDATLGWKNKEGHYVVRPSETSNSPIEVTFLEHGRRRTGKEQDDKKDAREMVIVGCSLTQGWAISDSDTFAWKLQQRYPAMDVLNYGTGGYGTYQSLLALERELEKLASPTIVLYGFMPDHDVRNVAEASYLASLLSAAKRGHVYTPFASLDEESRLVRNPPTKYLTLPGREMSAIVTLAERSIMKFLTKKRSSQRKMITEKIIAEMDNTVKKYGAQLYVVILSAKEAQSINYKYFFRNNDIKFIDCSFGKGLRDWPDEMRVPEDGHPSGKLTTKWAQCISDYLDNEVLMSHQ